MEHIYFSKPGVICAAGSSIEELWNSCITGNCDGIKQITAIDGKKFYVGRICDSLLPKVFDARYDMRIIRILDKALSQIEKTVEVIKSKYSSERIGVFIGTCDNGSEFSLKGHKDFFSNGKFPSDYKLDMQSADYPATFIKEKFGIQGPSYVFATACSSSATAIIKAREMIFAGIIDVAIVGGVDIASETVLLGFDSLEAVSDEKTNPFSKNRKGITLGEGAALFVLSKNLEDVSNSDDDFAIELLGIGESADANHITAPLEDGSGAAIAIKAALSDSFLDITDVDYLNLHGTGTHLNDAMESKALNKVFGNFLSELPVSSTKSLMGHTLGAASAIELAICFWALACSYSKKLPVHIWDGVFDDELPYLNFVKVGDVCKKEIRTAMSNSFGFGGCNVSLILRKERK